MTYGRNMYRNNTQKKTELNQKKIEAGFVSESFPQVSGIVIQMAYYQKLYNSVLMVRTVNIFPDDHAYFHMQCMMKQCTDGGFDLTSAITKLIKGRKKKGTGKLVCCGNGDDLPSDHASISYEITVKYKRSSK